MKEFFAKHGIWILLVAVIVTVTMAALSAFGTGVATPVSYTHLCPALHYLCRAFLHKGL